MSGWAHGKMGCLCKDCSEARLAQQAWKPMVRIDGVWWIPLRPTDKMFLDDGVLYEIFWHDGSRKWYTGIGEESAEAQYFWRHSSGDTEKDRGYPCAYRKCDMEVR